MLKSPYRWFMLYVSRMLGCLHQKTPFSRRPFLRKVQVLKKNMWSFSGYPPFLNQRVSKSRPFTRWLNICLTFSIKSFIFYVLLSIWSYQSFSIHLQQLHPVINSTVYVLLSLYCMWLLKMSFFDNNNIVLMNLINSPVPCRWFLKLIRVFSKYKNARPL